MSRSAANLSEKVPGSAGGAIKSLRLKDREPFGVGGRRWCFVHPDDPSLCVKVLRTDANRVVRKRGASVWPQRWRRQYDNNADELGELVKLERRIGRETMARHFPRCHGVQETDLGLGLVTDLVRDADGGIARSLREYLARGEPLENFRAAFVGFGDYLREHGILTRALLDHNLAVQRGREGTWTFYLIDGFGDSAWLPLARWFPARAKRRIALKINRGWQSFLDVEARLKDTEQAKKIMGLSNGFLRHR